MFYIIAYDTPSNKRRRKFSKTILAFGKRVQKSVFEARLERVEFLRLVEFIEKLIDPIEDNVRFYGVPRDALENALIYGQIPLLDDLDYEYI